MNVELGFWSLGAVFLLIAWRVPIGIALAGVAVLGIAYLRNWNVSFAVLGTTPFEFVAHDTLSAIPMFLLMGAIAHHSGISRSLFEAARLWLGGIPGGLAISTNFASAGFAAASGSSVATAAAMGRIAVPEMLRAGYDKGLATGVVASAGTLGSMIPPSIMFVLFGVFAEVSIVKLLIAGVIPGLLTAGIYALMIYLRAVITPEIAPRLSAADRAALKPQRWRALMEIWPLLILMAGIIGGLYSGVVTPTEAGAAGAAGALVIAVLKRRLGWRDFWQVLVQTGHTTASICFLIMGASLYSRMLALSGMPGWLGDTVLGAGFGVNGVVIAMILVMVLLGTILDSASIMLLVLPIAVPILTGLQVDLIWLGVIAILAVEIGLLTPPFGLAVYVIKSTLGPDTDITLGQIFKGAAPFALMMALVLALIFIFPALATALL